MSTANPTRADLLAVVERSPDALLARDRNAWLAVFGPQAQIEDPVGSRRTVDPTRSPASTTRSSARATSSSIATPTSSWARP